MRYDNAEDPAASDSAALLESQRDRILAEQRERQAAGLLGGLLTTDAGKPWSRDSVRDAKRRAGIIELPDIN
jgi:hypothetical protein